MTKKLEISRELAERLDSPHSYVRNLAREDLRALLAAEPSNKCGRCGASTVDGCNYLGCHFLESGNGAPVVGRQEPVAWVDPHSLAQFSSNERMWVRIAASLAENRTNGYTQPLYAEQPAPEAVVSMRNFANAMIDIVLEGADADGGHIQELAIKHGLLKPEQRTERCGDTCSCAEYVDFPVECFRKVKELNQ